MIYLLTIYDVLFYPHLLLYTTIPLPPKDFTPRNNIVEKLKYHLKKICFIDDLLVSV